MKFYYQIIFALSFLYTLPVLAFEINTHQAITRCATTLECNQKGVALNLNYFIAAAFLDGVNYESELFNGYGVSTFFSYAENGEQVSKDYSIKFKSKSYLDLIEAGGGIGRCTFS